MRRERPDRSAVTSYMETSAQCREFASLCVRLANQAGNERHQSVLNEMAEAWRELADEAEGEGQP